MKNTKWNFDNSYIGLSPKMYSITNPTTVTAPNTLLFNTELAKTIGLDIEETNKEYIASVFSGNTILQGASPIAQAYAGHQFGYFNMLGDGRAILLGELIGSDGKRIDIQLKGAGQTLYSRRGDGRATLRSMLREYLISEAMHGLGIPTSRSLAVVATGEKVFREEIHNGAVLTRIASSHIRVGTFEYVKQFLTKKELQELTDYTIKRHYPSLKNDDNKALALLDAVMLKQIDLIIDWMRVGFIHGVMNTDNMSVAGETFDYGPCAFMNAYDPKTVFSAIDTTGRYAFGNQPNIAYWNLSCLASSLLPLIHEETEKAISLAEKILNTFPTIYHQTRTAMMLGKLGFPKDTIDTAVREHISALLVWMEANQADYTNTFLALQKKETELTGIYQNDSFVQWYSKWKALLAKQGTTMEVAIDTMQKYNPAFIPRNHLVEKALDDACNVNDFTLFHQLQEVLKNPYKNNDSYSQLQTVPVGGDKEYTTYCGT